MDEQLGLLCLIISDGVHLIGSTREILESRKESNKSVRFLPQFLPCWFESLAVVKHLLGSAFPFSGNQVFSMATVLSRFQ